MGRELDGVDAAHASTGDAIDPRTIGTTELLLLLRHLGMRLLGLLLLVLLLSLLSLLLEHLKLLKVLVLAIHAADLTTEAALRERSLRGRGRMHPGAAIAWRCREGIRHLRRYGMRHLWRG